MLTFIPVFFFASEYAQVALGKTATEAGLYILYFFIGFIVAAQIGGRMLDRIGAKRPVVLGCAISAVGFWLWAGKVTELSFSSQQWFIILAGFGMGMMLGPASTDAVNRASRLSYGEASGITQTVRNYAAALGLAILGTILSLAAALARGRLADRAGGPERAGARRSRPSRPVARREWRRRGDPALRATGLRLRHALGVLRDGRDHGRGGGRRLHRPARGGAGGHTACRGARRAVGRRLSRPAPVPPERSGPHAA